MVARVNETEIKGNLKMRDAQLRGKRIGECAKRVGTSLCSRGQYSKTNKQAQSLATSNSKEGEVKKRRAIGSFFWGLHSKLYLVALEGECGSGHGCC